MKVNLVDRIAGIVTVLIGALSILEGIRLYPYRATISNGDHLFPLVVGAGLLVFGIILVLCGDQSIDFDAAASPKTLALIYGVSMVLLLYVILIQWTGYLLATFSAASIFFRWIGLFRWHVTFPAAIILTASLYLIFVQWLNVPLPSGVWEV